MASCIPLHSGRGEYGSGIFGLFLTSKGRNPLGELVGN